ncbi:uncharacterized protein A1O9_09837 [Exophiala aquamarina CBS 119918]|uniref:Uncharacterized protein n=1 Tax=Exophiala aquamarina CBS 119918 TaxID=1182545 RepID=A0A072P2W4_9EURO|nr:uncharacterized protein A1O9_09837 [Exophiala aquamarina CBS 119918]KEF54042.1 hypothetical protein A1O9_09837 [Exophiala aquamarina CBS 119918]
MVRHAQRRFKTVRIIFSALTGLNSVSYGYNAIILSTTLTEPSFIHYTGLDRHNDTNDLIGLTGSLDA